MFAFWSEVFDAAAKDDMVDLSETGYPERGVVGVCLPLPYFIGRPAPFFLLVTPRPTMAFFTRPQSASAAVKIVAPSTVSGDPNKTSPRKGKLFRKSPLILAVIYASAFTDSTQRQCRNILIYG
jgi:hypothetical protein